MIKTEFDKIYCINYLEAPDRRKFMEKQFNELGLDVTFYNALNYNRFFTEDIKQVICKRNYYNLNVFGCSHSHYSVLKEAQLLGYERILILEDDCCFIKDPEILEKYFNNIPEDADFIKYFFSISELCSFCPKFYYEKEWEYYKWINTSKIYENTPFINFKELPDWFPGSNSALAYSVNKKGIDYLVSFYENHDKYEWGSFAADQFPYLFRFSGLDLNNSPINSYFTNKTICIPTLCFSSSYSDLETEPEINLCPIFLYDLKDFYKNNLQSLLCEGR